MAKLPKRFVKFLQDYPEVGKAYKATGDAVAKAGPLDRKTQALVKVGLSVAAKLEGATHSNVRKALEAGCTPEEIRHAILQTLTTCGFPLMVAGMSWADDVLEEA